MLFVFESQFFKHKMEQLLQRYFLEELLIMNFNRLLQTCRVENSLLLLARIAYVYYIWLERKVRCFTKNLKSEDDVTRFMMEATHKKILLIAIV